MTFSAKYFNELTAGEVYEILKVRAQIFVVEQNCAYQDIDDADYESLHIFYKSGEKITAYLRAFYKDGDTVQVGRVLTLEHGKGLGGELLKNGIRVIKEKMNPKTIYIEAQSYAIGFYEREGFKVCSDEFLEDGIPHVKMELDCGKVDIHLAEENDFTAVRNFYWSLIERMENAEFHPGWQKGIYPTDDFLTESIKNKELYIGYLNGEIASCMVVNHKYNDGYNLVDWSVDADDSELLVIHALGVDPELSGRGIAKQMVKFVIDFAKERNLKTIRLDILGGNIPAERVYTKMGFEYLATLNMFYEDTGWTDYKAFEYIVR